MILGRVVSRLKSETGTCLELGPAGSLCCLVSLPVSFFSPLGGIFFFTCVSFTMRQMVIDKYNVEEERCCTQCCCFNPIVDALHFNCNYPCSFFQLYTSMKEWDEDDINAFVQNEQQNVLSSLRQPIINA